VGNHAIIIETWRKNKIKRNGMIILLTYKEFKVNHKSRVQGPVVQKKWR
jgi:hypothetical protein